MKRSKEVLVGAVIVAGAVVAVLGTLFLKGVDWRRTSAEIEAIVPEVGLLQEGADVRFRGVPIGNVKAIQLGSEWEAVSLVLSVPRDAVFPDDAAVLVSQESLFGDWGVSIVSRSQFPSYAFLQTSDSLVLPGYALPDISRLTATADEIAQNLNTISERFELAFTEETAQDIASAIANIEEVTTTLASLVERQATNLDAVAAEARTAADEIGNTAVAFKQIAARVDSIFDRGEVSVVLTEMRAAMASLRTAAEGLQDTDRLVERIDSTMARVDRIAARIEAGEGSLGVLLNDPSIAIRADSLLQQMNQLVEEFRENPRRFIRLSIFGG